EYKRGNPVEATTFNKRALAILERALGPDHPHVGRCSLKQGKICCACGHVEDADTSFKEAIRICKKTAPNDLAGLAKILEEYAGMLRTEGRAAEAEPYEARARSLREMTGRATAPK
ncbi:MAG: tetratricopeptide repeat protein, partial [Singulisphaera sp.]|nr:tetratricopeptide repeat protein [Singulisphaera sp.]